MGDAPAWALAIETSNPSAAPDGANAAGEIALARIDDASLLGLHTETVRAGNGRSDDLASAIDRLCRRTSVAPRDLSLIAVSAGPGGFTAVRIAIATTKMIAEATGAKCVPVPTASIVAEGHRARVDAPGAPVPPGRFLVALASKRDSAWCRVFTPDGAPDAQTEHDPPILHAEDLARLHGAAPLGAIVADRHLALPIRAWADGARVPIVPPVFSAVACLRLAMAPSGVELPGVELLGVDPASLAPIYPREPEAVTLWRARASPKA